MSALHQGEAEDARISTVSTTNQSYRALVWRKFRRSVPGMIGLVLVGMLLLTAIFAEFVAPMDPNTPTTSFAPPDHLSFYTKDGFTPWPVAYSIVEGAELDPVTFQPLTGPDLDHPRHLVLFAKGEPFHLWGLIPMDRHLFGVDDGSALHLLGTDKLGRDVLSRGVFGSRLSLMISLVSITLITIIGTLAGITSGYLGGRFDMWFQRFVEVILAFPQLPLYLALTTLIPVTAPSNLFLAFVIAVIVGLGYTGILVSFVARHHPLAIIPVAILLGGFGAAGSMLQRRMGLPDASVHVLLGFAFVLVLAAECWRGRLRLPRWLSARPAMPVPAREAA